MSLGMSLVIKYLLKVLISDYPLRDESSAVPTACGAGPVFYPL